MKAATSAKPKTVDAYLKPLTADKRAALQKLRKTIQAAAPRAVECISYGLPAFRLDCRILVWFGAATGHCSFYPGAVVQRFAKELADYSLSKGTIRFTPDHPLPATLVRRLVKIRIAENSARQELSARKARL